MKIGLPGSYEPKRTDSLAHHSQISEAFGLDTTKQILSETQSLSNEYKTTDQKIKDVFGPK